jgi:transglutaminase-like putative cysteine protease
MGVVLTVRRDDEPGPLTLQEHLAATTTKELLEGTAGPHDAAVAAATRFNYTKAQAVWDIVRGLVQFVTEHVGEGDGSHSADAAAVLRRRRGDSFDRSVLFASLARSARIPARVVAGMAYSPPTQSFGWHAWAEVALAGIWHRIDPDWNQLVADVTHVALRTGPDASRHEVLRLLAGLEIADIAFETR